jgi:hypothetical protein
VETDDCERVCHFFEPMYYDKEVPEQAFFSSWPDANHLLPDGSPQKISGVEIGVRVEGNPYVVRTNVLGEEADLVYIDAFFPNGAGGLGGKVKMLVDVVPVGQKTYLDVGFQKKSNPSEGFPPGSPYGYWARGRSAQDLNVKIEWFKKPGNAARVLFPVNFQGPDIEQENNKDGTSNLKIRYIQELLKDSNYRNELQKFANGYQRFRRGVNTTMEVSEDLVIPALDSSIIERLNK